MNRACSVLVAACFALGMTPTDLSAQQLCEPAPGAALFTPDDAIREQVRAMSEDASMWLDHTPRGKSIGPGIQTGVRTTFGDDGKTIANAYKHRVRIRTAKDRLTLDMAFGPIIDDPNVPASSPPSPFRIVMDASQGTTFEWLDPVSLSELEQEVARCAPDPAP